MSKRKADGQTTMFQHFKAQKMNWTARMDHEPKLDTFAQAPLAPPPSNVITTPAAEVAQPAPAEPTKSKWRNVEADCALFKSKLREYLAEGKTLKLKKGCKFEDDEIWMECVQCHEYKLRNTRHFNSDGSKHFATCPPGHEQLKNSKLYPCKECQKDDRDIDGATPKGFITCLLRPYPALSREWFAQTFEAQGGRGPISNFPMLLQKHVQNAAGIHRRDNSLGHIPENCFLEVQEINVSQYMAIPCLFAAWRSIYGELARRFSENPDVTNFVELFRNQYYKTVSDLGCRAKGRSQEYEDFRHQRHFKTIVRIQIGHHIDEDLAQKRFTLPFDRAAFSNVVYEKAILQLEKQNARCAYSDAGLTHTRAYNQMSFERVNNKLPHFDQDGGLSNCVFVCRLFNGKKQLSAKLILQYFLHQTMVPLSEQTRAKAHQAWLEAK
jgi:hypothetical protein